MTNSYQINAQSGDLMICQLIERKATIDHHDNNRSINRLNHNQYTALVKTSLLLHNILADTIIGTPLAKSSTTVCHAVRACSHQQATCSHSKPVLWATSIPKYCDTPKNTLYHNLTNESLRVA